MSLVMCRVKCMVRYVASLLIGRNYRREILPVVLLSRLVSESLPSC